MRVGIDSRSLRSRGEGRGVARYLESLQAGFPAEDELVPLGAGRAANAAAALLGRPRLDRRAPGLDVVWAPAPAPLAVSPGVPLVLTVHDLSFEHSPGDYTAYERFWHQAARPRRLAARAARVIAVSDSVRDELLGEWGLEPERVVTVRSGPGRPQGPPAPDPADPAPGYLLVVGALEPRKRPDLVLEAWAAARREGLAAELVFAGEGRLRGEAEAAGATVVGRVGDARLDGLFTGALGVVCASREEGFGFTPLEALARGVPAVVADLPPFRETLGEAALRVPPGDAAALAAALLRLEREPELRERLLAAAPAALELLSWERAARETRTVLVEAAA